MQSLEGEERSSPVHFLNTEVLAEIDQQAYVSLPISILRILLKAKLSGTARNLYIYLYGESSKNRHRHGEVRAVLYSRRKLCGILECKKTAIDDAIRNLREAGWLHTKSRYHEVTGSQCACSFWVDVPKQYAALVKAAKPRQAARAGTTKEDASPPKYPAPDVAEQAAAEPNIAEPEEFDIPTELEAEEFDMPIEPEAKVETADHNTPSTAPLVAETLPPLEPPIEPAAATSATENTTAESATESVESTIEPAESAIESAESATESAESTTENDDLDHDTKEADQELLRLYKQKVASNKDAGCRQGFAHVKALTSFGPAERQRLCQLFQRSPTAFPVSPPTANAGTYQYNNNNTKKVNTVNRENKVSKLPDKPFVPFSLPVAVKLSDLEKRSTLVNEARKRLNTMHANHQIPKHLFYDNKTLEHLVLEVVFHAINRDHEHTKSDVHALRAACSMVKRGIWQTPKKLIFLRDHEAIQLEKRLAAEKKEKWIAAGIPEERLQ